MTETAREDKDKKEGGGKNVRKYNVLPRSMLDPKINDPDAPTHVFHEATSKKDKAPSSSSERNNTSSGRNNNAGQAVMYNIHFDDTDYDYTQHLMQAGDDPSDIYIPASSSVKPKKKGDLANAIEKEDELSWRDVVQDQAQYYERSLQPDMDPDMREIYEALDHDEDIESADVDELDRGDGDGDGAEEGEEEEGEEDFFSSILKKGIPGQHSSKNSYVEEKSKKPEIGQGWLDEMEKYKSTRQEVYDGSEDGDEEEDDYGSEALDTIGDLDSNAGGKRRRRKLPSEVGSGMSMSSSVMYRNDALKTLDEKFDVIQAEYATTDEEDEFDEDDFDEEGGPEDPNETREDFNEIMDDFLTRFEVLGKKAVPTNGEGPLDALGSFRQALRVEKDEQNENSKVRRRNKEIWPERPVPKAKERWDCESVLSTYSNQANHPRMLRLQETLDTRGPKFKIDARRGIGLSVVEDKKEEKEKKKEAKKENETVHTTRMRGESSDERKARKKEGKAERQRRRVEKKERKEAFSRERARVADKDGGNMSVIV